MMPLQDFAVIDICSQGDAIAAYTKGWPPDEVLLWLQRYGHVCKVGDAWQEARYCHTSHFGLRGHFYFTETGEFTIWNSGWLY